MLSYKVTKEIIKIITFPIFLSPVRKKVKNYLKNEVFNLPYRKQKEFYDHIVKYCSHTAQVNCEAAFTPPEQLPIWQIWFQGEASAPNIVKLCFESVEKYAGDRKIIRLTEENYLDYIELPEYIIEKYKKGIITPVHLSDIIRVCLLAKYGGTWIDATVLLTHKIPPQILQSNFFAFRITKDSAWFDCHTYLAFASWFMHSQPNNNLICSVRNALFDYWKNEDKIIDYFLIYFIFRCLIDEHKCLADEWNASINLIEEPTHLMQLSFNEDFCLEKLEEIKNKSSIHKLTYRYKDKVNGSFLDRFFKEKDLFY